MHKATIFYQTVLFNTIFIGNCIYYYDYLFSFLIKELYEITFLQYFPVKFLFLSFNTRLHAR